MVSHGREATPQDLALGMRVRRIRRWRGVSQTELAARVTELAPEGQGISFQQVQKLERGGNRMFVTRLEEIAEALEVPTWVFLDPKRLQLPGVMNPSDSIMISVANTATRNDWR